MILCKVTGTLNPGSYLKTLAGASFVEVERLDGGALVVMDTLEVKPGQTVIVCTGPAAQSALDHNCPVDAVVTAVLDTEQ